MDGRTDLEALEVVVPTLPNSIMKDTSAAKCTRECTKSGSDYALVIGEKVYTLKGNKSDIDKLAGERATVKGKVSGNTITVDSISAAK